MEGCAGGREIKRLARLQKQQVGFNESFVGELVPVLLDRYGRRDSQLARPWIQQCLLTSKVRPGRNRRHRY